MLKAYEAEIGYKGHGYTEYPVVEMDENNDGEWYKREDVDKELALLREVAKAAHEFWKQCDNEDVANLDSYDSLEDALYNLEAADAANELLVEDANG